LKLDITNPLVYKTQGGIFMRHHLLIIVSLIALLITSCKPSSETANKAVDQTQSAQATITNIVHREEINREIVLEVVKDKTKGELSSTISQCLEFERLLGNVGEKAANNCASVEIWTVDKEEDGIYIVTLKNDDSKSGASFNALAKYIYGDEFANGAIFRVVLDNNVVIPKNSFAESLVR
jgi:hypothetical protein